MTKPGNHAKSGKILSWDLIAVFFVGIIAIVVNNVPQVVSAAHIPLLWNLLATCNVAVLAALITHAVQTSVAKTKALSAAILVALMLPAGIYVYHRWFDPSRSQDFQLVVDGSESQKTYM